MSDRHTTRWLSPLILSACLGLSAALQAQPQAQATLKTVAAPMPPMPQMKSPVDQFRELLALPSAERESHLTNRPAELRRRILAKLQEYDGMKADERELRLSNTQLRWYLLSFMEMPANERATQLAMVPEADRPLIKKHLEDWDRLPADEQKEVLKYEKVMEGLLAQGITNTITVPTPSPTPDIIKNFNAFLTLSQDKRQQMYASFQQFFELSDDERQKTMGALPALERRQMTNALKKFDQLPKPLRDRCLKSFAEFSSLSESERQEFLKNAEHWRELPPAARKAWRDLVNQTPPLPPLPAGFALPPSLPRRAPLQVSFPNSPP